MRTLIFTLSFLCTLCFAFDSTIPVLDMNAFHNPKTRPQFLADLENALREVGFFGIVNTGIDPQILDGAYAASRTFFSKDLPEKMRVNDPSNNGQRGYVLSESAKGTAFKDCKEFLHIGRELEDNKLSEVKGYPNIWPESMDLKKPMLALFEALEAGMRPLERAFAMLVGKPENYFSDMTREGNCLIRSLHYPANPPEGNIWAAEHTDIDLFTILPRATAAGLQVKNNEGLWVDVKVPDGAFIINAGDMLENVSNGLFRSSVHRVVDNGINEDRYSIVFFVHARGDDDLSPLPSCVEKTGGVKRYANGTEWDLLCERLADLGLASKQMLEDLGKSGFLERQIAVGRESEDAMRAVADAGFASPAVKKRLSNTAQIGTGEKQRASPL